MKRKLLFGLLIVVLLGGTGTNAYYLWTAYQMYHTDTARTSATLGKSASSKIANAKEKVVTGGTAGEKVSTGSYKFDELSHSKIQPDDGSSQLVIASNEALGANYVLADSTGGTLSANKLTSDWTLQTINKDPMWAPGGCAAKPTYFLQKHYIFIDDGKTLPTDKYNSYVVFDLLTQKYRYFGGDNFTAVQAQREKILSAVDENDQIVFYLDTMDAQGPLANSASFKHARADAPGYIIRRVIDPATMQYTDYHLNFTVPQDPAFTYYYVDIGTSADNLINISSDNNTDYYTGKVSDNKIILTKASTTQAPAQSVVPVDPLATKLDPILASTLPAFLQSSGGANGGSQGAPRFDVNVLGSQGSLQYLVVSGKDSGYSTPLVYDASTSKASPMTTQPLFDLTSYVPLGVF